MFERKCLILWLGLTLVGLSGGCAPERDASRTARLRGKINIDGSSTVYPIFQAAAESYLERQPRIDITVGSSGTNGGFKKFLEERESLRIDMTLASRPISTLEQDRAKRLGVEYIELPVAYDGIAVLVNPGNHFCDHLTVDELRAIWKPDSTITSWKDVRPGFPDWPLKLFGPGTDSGTFDYFTEAINGKSRSCRSDFSPSEDDNVLVMGVQGERGALGYFGFSYYDANKEKLRLLAIRNGSGPPVLPSLESIRDFSYRPLTRPLFLYVNALSLRRPEVAGFIDFFFNNARAIVEDEYVQYIALEDTLYGAVRKRLAGGVTGTLYADAGTHGKNLYQLFGLEPAASH